MAFPVASRSHFVIVIARCQGFMAVNEPSPRAQPEDEVCLLSHKSLATRAISHLIGSNKCACARSHYSNRTAVTSCYGNEYGPITGRILLYGKYFAV